MTYYQRADDRWIEHRPAPETFRADKPFPAGPVIEADDLVLARAGAKVRDADDLRIINEVNERTGRVGGSKQSRICSNSPGHPP